MAEITVPGSNPLDTCRLCTKYLKNGPNGTFNNTHAIFKVRPDSVPLAARLAQIGVTVSPCSDRSRRLCGVCYRRIPHVESALDTLRSWRRTVEEPTCSSDVRFITDLDLKRQAGDPGPGRGGDGKRPRLSKIRARKSTVEIHIKYPCGKGKNKIVSPEVSGMIDHLAYGNWQVFAKFALEHKRTSPAIRELLRKKVEQETKALSETFILKKTSLDDLKDFSYGAMETELCRKLPWFYAALSSVTGGSTIHNCVAASVALRSREPRFSALALVINSIILHGGAKAMFKKLSQMGITTASTSKQRELLAASGRKKEPVCWRPDCERHYQHLASGEVCRRLTAEEIENLNARSERGRDEAEDRLWESALRRVERGLKEDTEEALRRVERGLKEDTEEGEIVEVSVGSEKGKHLKEEDSWSDKEVGYEEGSWPPVACGEEEDTGAGEQGVGGGEDDGDWDAFEGDKRNEAPPQREKDGGSLVVKEEGDCPPVETEHWGLQLTCDSE